MKQSGSQTRLLMVMERIVKQKIYDINNKKKLLRVICESEDKDTIVVTAYLTSQIKKYWRSK